MNFPFPVLLCDIGGTNARFALARSPAAPLEYGPHLKTGDYPSFEAAVANALPRLDVKPRSLIACAAGPVNGRSVRLTNAAWSIDGVNVAEAAGLGQGLLLNDFEAQALALPALQPAWTKPIGGPFDTKPGAQLILGLGTGLGAAALLEIEGRHFALASEAGHMDFGPVGAEQAAIWRHLDASEHGRISVETVLSGAGLARLHRARCAAAGRIAPDFDEVALIENAHTQPNGEEAKTLRLAWTLVARFTGDLTLALLAKGGVTFSGGVLPRLADFLDPHEFRAHFEDKAPFGDMMRGIGARLIIAEDVVLPGMAAIAAAPQAYAIDYARRAWR
ncbi:glucokinase [Methylocapsa polymorpha]|uniref:Glucokinase n=1 Tax=Methylocapsa polymorpha TaxID=3080828 RepID=A0ABZ0HRN1_9HYPH|nr:glucokinase [Methylocapsa sp. RX1]